VYEVYAVVALVLALLVVIAADVFLVWFAGSNQQQVLVIHKRVNGVDIIPIQQVAKTG